VHHYVAKHNGNATILQQPSALLQVEVAHQNESTATIVCLWSLHYVAKSNGRGMILQQPSALLQIKVVASSLRNPMEMERYCSNPAHCCKSRWSRRYDQTLAVALLFVIFWFVRGPKQNRKNVTKTNQK
jgi:hypothetical protein